MVGRMANKQDADRFGQTIAAQVRAEIAAADETVASIARKSGINRETLDSWVKGERPLSMPTLFRIADTLGVDASTIVRRAEERFDAADTEPANVTQLRPRPTVATPAHDLEEVAAESITWNPDDTEDKYDS